MFRFNILEPYTERLEHGVTMDLFEVEGAMMADQLHTDVILKVDEKPEVLPQCDAFITDQKGLPLMVKVADCQGVLIYDPMTHSGAAVHSGWKGSALNIIGKTIQEMQDKFGAETGNLRVAISPSLGPCCAEFSDPKNELPDFCQEFVGENKHVDFWQLSIKQCEEAGIPIDQIEVAGICSKCQPGYFSHRNGDSERMGVFVTLL